MNIEERYESFMRGYWEKQCCSSPCINTRDEDFAYLDGVDAFYKFLIGKEEE